jgi:hypothetical protein
VLAVQECTLAVGFMVAINEPSILVRQCGVPRNFVRGGGGSTNSVDDGGQRERGSGGSSPLVMGSGGSCNLVQEILFHMVKFS